MIATTDNKYRHIPANCLGGQISASLARLSTGCLDSIKTAWQGTQLTSAVRPSVAEVRPTTKAAELEMGLFGH